MPYVLSDFLVQFDRLFHGFMADDLGNFIYYFCVFGLGFALFFRFQKVAGGSR